MPIESWTIQHSERQQHLTLGLSLGIISEELAEIMDMIDNQLQKIVINYLTIAN